MLTLNFWLPTMVGSWFNTWVLDEVDARAVDDAVDSLGSIHLN